MSIDVEERRDVIEHPISDKLENLLERKKRGHELDREPRINVIHDFIESELERLETIVSENKSKPDIERLNELFRLALNEVQ